MSTFESFEEIVAWQSARDLTRCIYSATRGSQFSTDYPLRDQMRRAVISVTSNIAEGFERNSNRAFIHYLSIAKASAGEVRSQLYVALDEQYLSPDEFAALYELADVTSRQIGALIRYLRGRRPSLPPRRS